MNFQSKWFSFVRKARSESSLKPISKQQYMLRQPSFFLRHIAKAASGFCLFAATLASANTTEPNFQLANAYGKHAVGFRLVQQYDFSRSMKGKHDLVTGEAIKTERARPVQTLIWYPSDKPGKPLRFIDYLRTTETRPDFQLPGAEIERKLKEKTDKVLRVFGNERGNAEVQAVMRASKGTSPASGKYPVLIYAPGAGGEAMENVDNFEYLASHGYIVISSASQGPLTNNVSIDMAGLDAQARDIQFLLAYASTVPEADLSKIAVMGFSWGGMANFVAASRDSRISALISLDGSLRRFTEFAKQIPAVSITVPTLFIHRGNESLEELSQRNQDMSYSALNSMKYMDLIKITMPWMQHVDFASDSLRMGSDLHFSEYTRKEIGLAHSWVSRYVLEFLNAKLKANTESERFLQTTPVKNGAPAHMMYVQHRPALPGALPTRSGFIQGLAKQDFQGAEALYDSLHKLNPEFVLKDSDLNAWGYELLRQNKLKAALAIFRLNTHLSTDSFNAFDSLGEAYEVAGNKDLAIVNYRQSLKLNPDNKHAEQQLKELETSNQQDK